MVLSASQFPLSQPVDEEEEKGERMAVTPEATSRSLRSYTGLSGSSQLLQTHSQQASPAIRDRQPVGGAQRTVYTLPPVHSVAFR